MNKILVANWKMHPLTQREALALAKASDAKGVVICPPYTYVSSVRRHVSRAKVGAQDVFWEEKGAYTGEVSPLMLKKIGVSYVILGHSERRRYQGETDEMINKKVKAALFAGLKVILCVGEPLAVRKKGFAAAKKYVASQLRKDLSMHYPDAHGSGLRLKRRSSLFANIIIAYEPIWAIGSGKPETPEGASAMAVFIKKLLATYYPPESPSATQRRAGSLLTTPRVLYGGSVSSGNLKRFITSNHIDGALVGGASIKPEEFKRIIKIASK